MSDTREPESIGDVLECVEDVVESERHVCVADIVERIGDDAFPPLMLVPALLMVSPATVMFGVATICAIMIAMVAGQMVIGRSTIWLPSSLLNQKVSARHVEKGLGFLTPPARAVDSLVRPRLSAIVEAPFDRVWAALCLLLCLFIPVLELVPLSATVVAAAISLFCLAMLARDGMLALIGTIVLASAGWLFWNLFT